MTSEVDASIEGFGGLLKLFQVHSRAHPRSCSKRAREPVKRKMRIFFPRARTLSRANDSRSDGRPPGRAFLSASVQAHGFSSPDSRGIAAGGGVLRAATFGRELHPFSMLDSAMWSRLTVGIHRRRPRGRSQSSRSIRTALTARKSAVSSGCRLASGCVLSSHS